jgi:predicted nuclease of predicted toxin-antitoxin system
MRVRLFLDEDVHFALADALRKRGYDVRHTGEEQRFGQSDAKQLQFAAATNRCLMTFNVGDFVQLHNLWLQTGRKHAGIIVSKQLPVGECLRRLLTIMQRETVDSMRDQLRFL